MSDETRYKGGDIVPTYTKTTWVNGSAPAVSASNLNKIEKGIENATQLTGRASTAATGWNATTLYGFRFRKDVAIAGVTSAMYANVLFTPSSLELANTANVAYAETYAGGITLYADTTPTDTIVFDFICTRSSGFVPSDVSGLRLWLDASDASTITQSGGAVSQWNDKSGNGFNAAMSVPSIRPLYNATGFNGYPAITWNNTSTCAMDVGITINTEYSIFAAFRQNTGASYQRVINGVSSFGDDQNLLLGTFEQKTLTVANWTTNPLANNPHYYNTTVTPIVQFMACGQSGGVDVVVPRINGNVQDTRTSARRNLTFLQLFARDGYLNVFEGALAEVLIYNRVLSSAEVELIEGYFMFKYDVVKPFFPTSHPYYNVSP